MAKHRRDSDTPRHVAVFVDTVGSYGRRLLEGIADYLETHPQWSIYLQPRATGQFDPTWLRRWKGDGVLAFVEDRESLLRLRRRGIPVVETYGHLGDLKTPCVSNDDRAVGRMAAEHLLARRFEHFAFSGYPDQPWCERRFEGFCETLRNAGRDCVRWRHPRSFRIVDEWEKAQRELAEWIAALPQPLGVMACSDRHALNVLDACRRAKRTIPDQAAVIGVDNDPSICRLASPPLSSVADNPHKIGYEAAKLLDRLMLGEPSQKIACTALVPPLGVIARRSTDVTVTDDPMVREVLQYIRVHACEDINVATILKRLPISRSAFYRRFQRAVGRPLHEQLLLTRLHRVKEMAAQTALPLAQIAPHAGFEHVEYMGAAFKRVFGMTPGEYRKTHRPAGASVERS
jgi:LacI family transcriptional regulator